MKDFKKLIRNSAGISMVELSVAMAVTSVLSLSIAQMMQNSSEQGKQLEAKSAVASVDGSIQGVLANPQACKNTFSPYITQANLATLSASTSNQIAVATVKNRNNLDVYGLYPTFTNVEPARIKSMYLTNYKAADSTATLVVNSEFQRTSTKKQELKPRKINVSIDINNTVPATPTITSCMSLSSGGNVGQWQDMASPLLGIFYNQGAVMVGSGTVDTGNVNYPAFGLGYNNTVRGYYSSGFGSSNNIDSSSVASTVSGNSNTITASAFSAAIGQGNTVNISTGVFGGDGPMASMAIGRLNSATGSEAVALGFGNTVTQQYAHAIGVGNTASGAAAMALGGFNLATGSGSMALGQYTEANGDFSMSFGTRAKSNANGAMTLADSSGSAASYLINGIINSFSARFDNGYTFYTDPLSVGSSSVSISATGNVGVGTGSSAVGSRLAVQGNGNASVNGGYSNVAIFAYDDSGNGGTAISGRMIPDQSGNAWSVGVQGICDFTTPQALTGWCMGGIFSGYTATPSTNGQSWGVMASAGNATSGYNFGVAGSLRGSNGGAAIYGTTDNSAATWSGLGDTQWAGYFNGPVNINGGNLGIGTGTTTPPARKLEVAGTIRSTPGNYGIGLELGSEYQAVVRARAGVTTGYFDLTNIQFRDSSSGGNAVVGIAGSLGIGNWGPAYPLDVTGNMRASGSIYHSGGCTGTCPSDKRIKKDIHSFDLGLKEIIGIKPVYYKNNGLGGIHDDGKEYIGVIAQDLEKVAPSLIVPQKVKMKPTDKKLTEIKTVNYHSFTYLAINAIKELYTKVMELFKSDESQNREISSLKSQNEELKKELLEQRESQREMKAMLCAQKQNANTGFCKN